MSTYNKLVRNRITKIIQQSGKQYRTRILNNDEYIRERRQKAHEELSEYMNAENDQDSLEELADLLEIIHALSNVHGATADQLDQIRRKKSEKRGGFQDKVFLIDVDDE